MNLDELLRESLKESGDAHRPRKAEARQAFLRRARRRRTLARGSLTLAGAATAALSFVLLSSDIELPRPAPNETGGLDGARVTATIPVGEAPISVTVGLGAVWVANSGDGTVTRVDPATNEVAEVIEVGGVPAEVEVAGGMVWVAFDDRPVLAAISPQELSVRELPLAGGGSDLDIASGDEDLWVVSHDTPLQRIDTEGFRVVEQVTSVEEPTDVAVGGGKVWVLGGEGAIDQIDQGVGVAPETTIPLPSSVSATAGDMVHDGAGLWVSDGDSRTIFRVDPQSAVVTADVDFNGRFADLTVSQGALWALVGNETNSGSLLAIDLATGLARPGSLGIGGTPVDITEGSGSLWAVSRSAGLMRRIDLQRPPPTPVVLDDERILDQDLIYVFADPGGLSGVGGDSRVETITEAPDRDANPNLISDDTIAFERLDPATQTVTLVTRNLSTGVEETTPVTGTEVALGPEGSAAWVLPKAQPSEQAQIRIGGIDGTGDDFFVANEGFDPQAVTNLEWDASGDKLYYQAGADTVGLYEVDVDEPAPRAIDPPEAGAAYLAPSSTQPGELVVVRVCCDEGGTHQTVEFGRVSLGKSPPSYTKIAGLDDVGFDPTSEAITLEFAGRLDVESSPEGPVWTETPVRAWFVSDGRSSWLIDEESEIDVLTPGEVTGAAISPQWLD